MATRLAELPSSLPPLDWSLVVLLGSLGVLSLLAAWIVRQPGWRRWYVVTAITEAALMFFAIHMLNHLSRWEELEIFAVAAGVGLLAIGHVGWYREDEKQEDMVSFNLGTGALLVAVPLAIAVLVHRSVPDFSALERVGHVGGGRAAAGHRLHVPDPLHDAHRGRLAGDLPRDPGAVHQHARKTCRRRPSG